jgi:anti-sigma factor RsiW
VTRPEDPRDRALSAEEARWLDGTLDAESARRMERLLAADPARARRLARDREALDLWVGDARRQAARSQAREAAAPDLADAVLAQVARGPGRSSPRGGEILSPRAAMGYAAAALLLMGVGLGGTWLVRGQRAEAVPSTGHDATAPDPDAPLLDGVSTAVRRGMVRRPVLDDGAGGERHPDDEGAGR